MKLTASTIINFLDYESAEILANFITDRLNKQFIIDDIKDFESIDDYFYIENPEQEDFVSSLTADNINALTTNDITIDSIESIENGIIIWISCDFNTSKERTKYTVYNKSQDFRILVKAFSENEAIKLAQAYGNDADLNGDWIIENNTPAHYDCDYIIQAPEFETDDIEYIDK